MAPVEDVLCRTPPCPASCSGRTQHDDAFVQEWDGSLPRRSRSKSDPVPCDESTRRVAELEGMVNMIVGRISHLEGSVCNMSTASLAGSISSASTSAFLPPTAVYAPRDRTPGSERSDAPRPMAAPLGPGTDETPPAHAESECAATPVDAAVPVVASLAEGSALAGSFLSCADSCSAAPETAELQQRLALSSEANADLRHRLEQYQKGFLVLTVALMEQARQGTPSASR